MFSIDAPNINSVPTTKMTDTSQLLLNVILDTEYGVEEEESMLYQMQMHTCMCSMFPSPSDSLLVESSTRYARLTIKQAG